MSAQAQFAPPTASVRSFEGSSIRLALIGDIHGLWQEGIDDVALSWLGADLAVFVGDYGEEDVELVGALARCSHPKLVMLGNHDAWFNLTARGRQRARMRTLLGNTPNGVQQQLQTLGTDHIGFSSHALPHRRISVVGARPFSKGGPRWGDVKEFYSETYGVKTLSESADRIVGCALHEPEGHALVVVGHNGPSGLGSHCHDICGVDWMAGEGDHGDPDLEDAIRQVQLNERHVALVLFGHMHHVLKGGRLRNMAAIAPHSGTVFLNCAQVPRIRGVSRGSDHDWTDRGGDGSGVPMATRARHFMVVDIRDGHVAEAEDVWLQVLDAAAGTCQVAHRHQVLRTDSFNPNEGILVRSCYQAHDASWQQEVTRVKGRSSMIETWLGEEQATAGRL